MTERSYAGEQLTMLRSVVAGGQTVGFATVIRTWRSAPRAPGSTMLVRSDGTVAGSVSGGCIDSDVYESAMAALTSGTASVRTYGEVSPEAITIGVPCGGEIEVLVEALGPVRAAVLVAAHEQALAGHQVEVTTVVEHRDPAMVGDRSMAALAGSDRSSLAHRLLTTDGKRVFVQAFRPLPRLVICGANEHAAALSRLGGFLGRHVTVVDPRPVFATADRFPAADEVVRAWPQAYLFAQAASGLLDERAAVVVAGHDPRTEVPTLIAALGLDLAYVGALGSRRTHELRMAQLRMAGVDEKGLAALHSPAGLDLGGHSPEQTALSIVAEIVAVEHTASGRPLRDCSGPVHGQQQATRDR